jgi:hypothetical protein
MAQLINEAKRFQQLAGINVKEEYDSNVVEGLNIFLDAIGHNLLLEAEEKQSVLSKILDTPGKALLSLLNVVYNQISPDQQQSLKSAIEYISSNNLSKEDIIKSLKGSIAEALPDDEIITTPSDETKLTAKNPLSNLQRFLKTIPGKISKTIITLLIGFALYGPMIKNAAIGAKDFYNPTKIEQTSNSNNLDVKTGIDKNDYKQADNVGVKVDGKTLSQIDDESNTVVAFVPFKYGKGTMPSVKGNQELQKIINAVEKIIKDDPNAKVNIKVTGTVSKTTGDVKKGTDTNLPLDVARTQSIVKFLTSYFGNNPNVKISENPNDPDAYKTQTQEKIGGEAASGAVIKINSENSSAPKEADLLSTLNPLRKYKPNEIPVTPDNTPEPTPTPTPSPTPVIPAPQFGKLNRNGQIATILATISPELDITKKIGTDSITSYSDKQLTAMPAEAQSIANLIINIRKNPDSLLKRLSTDLGVKLDKRARAITTAVNRNTQAQLQSITEEIISEAAIDDMFSRLGITGEDIKKNEVALLSYLGTMYASEGNNTLSILNPKNIDPDKLSQLKNLGFAPQPGGNYVFLGNQTKKQALIQADVTRVIDSIGKNKSLVTALKRINKKEELMKLLKAITQYVNVNVKTKPDQMRTDLFTVGNQIKMKEAEEDTKTLPDVTNALKIIDTYAGLKSLLNNINDRKEFKQFISGLLSFIDPFLFDRKADVKGAVIGVANSLTNKDTVNKPKEQPIKK